MDTLQLNISGMTCGGCAAGVKRVLSDTEGVAAAEVDWQAGRAEVQFDSTKTSAAALVAAVEEAGFDAEAV